MCGILYICVSGFVSVGVCIVIVFVILFCLLYYGCPQSAFPPATVVVFMLLFAFPGARWHIVFVNCSAAGVAKVSKVRCLASFILL